jgi:large subunit ribosomal protein L25
MPDNILLAEARPERGSRRAGRIRRQGKVPAVVYGLDSDTLTVSVPARELAHILTSATGVNTLITLKLDGKEHLTLARQIQRHPTRGEFIHVDFIRIRADVAVQAEVAVRLEGEPIGVREGGVLEQLVLTLSIEAKPADIPVALELDVTPLDIGDQLHVFDLSLPSGVTTSQEAEELVVQVVAPRVVEEEVPAEGEEGLEGEEGEVAEGEGGEAAEGSEGSEDRSGSRED